MFDGLCADAMYYREFDAGRAKPPTPGADSMALLGEVKAKRWPDWWRDS